MKYVCFALMAVVILEAGLLFRLATRDGNYEAANWRAKYVDLVDTFDDLHERHKQLMVRHEALRVKLDPGLYATLTADETLPH